MLMMVGQRNDWYNQVIANQNKKNLLEKAIDSNKLKNIYQLERVLILVLRVILQTHLFEVSINKGCFSIHGGC